MKLTKSRLRRIIFEELSKIVEEEEDAYEGRPLEAPLAESDFELDMMQRMRKMQHMEKIQENLQMRLLNLELWATDQGYRRDK